MGLVMLSCSLFDHKPFIVLPATVHHDTDMYWYMQFKSASWHILSQK